jgi:hypothetical protein
MKHIPQGHHDFYNQLSAATPQKKNLRAGNIAKAKTDKCSEAWDNQFQNMLLHFV